ncbi:hypothetical protein [Vulcanisaeta souniana]|uniref:hypothetical protein n=1 Tax=Vulcanisaeta souniana TaxID=164452 RepID=UPI001FB2047C|nr:hypothetical protein [Vulcanisaeta souniana]
MNVAIDVLVMTTQLIAIIDPVGALPIIMEIPSIDKPVVFNRALRIIASQSLHYWCYSRWLDHTYWAHLT